MAVQTAPRNDLTERFRQAIAQKVPEACETNRAETLLSTLSFQSTVCPERHVWIDTDLEGIGIDLEDWNVEEEGDTAVACIRVDSLEEAVELVRVWLFGENLDSYANLNKEDDKIRKIAPTSSSKK